MPFTAVATTAAGWAAGIAGAGAPSALAGATLGTIAADLALVGTGVAVAGQMQAGKQAQANAEYNAQIQANQAIREEQAAASEADIRQERGRKLMAAQRVGFAKAGVGLEGTPLLVFEQTAADIAKDVALTRYGGAQRAAYSRSQSGLSIMQGQSARRASRIGAFGSLLSGTTSSLQTYQYFK